MGLLLQRAIKKVTGTQEVGGRLAAMAALDNPACKSEESEMDSDEEVINALKAVSACQLTICLHTCYSQLRTNRIDKAQ